MEIGHGQCMGPRKRTYGQGTRARANRGDDINGATTPPVPAPIPRAEPVDVDQPPPVDLGTIKPTEPPPDELTDAEVDQALEALDPGDDDEGGS